MYIYISIYIYIDISIYTYIDIYIIIHIYWYIYIYKYTYYKQDILPKSIFLSHKSGFPSIQTQTLIWSNLSKKARLASNAPNINLPCSSTVASRFSCAKVFLMTRMPWLCHKPYSTSHVAGECNCGPPISYSTYKRWLVYSLSLARELVLPEIQGKIQKWNHYETYWVPG